MLNNQTTGRLLENSYQDKPKEEIGGYLIDKSLSGKRVQVYTNDEGKAVIAHRGTKGFQDILTDVKVMFGNKDNDRFKHAKKIQKQAEEKYGKENTTTIGHSLGSIIAEDVGQKSDKLITYNKPVGLLDINKKVSNKQTDIRTSRDPLSLLRGLKKGNKEQIIKK